MRPPSKLNHCWADDCARKARPNQLTCTPHHTHEDKAAKASVVYMPNVGTVKIRRSIKTDMLEVQVMESLRGDYHKKGDIVIRRPKAPVLADTSPGVSRRWR